LVTLRYKVLIFIGHLFIVGCCR